MSRAPVVAFALLALQACIFHEKECPCGASTQDPIGQHDLTFAGDHEVDGQCLCTCGDDFPESFDADRSCSEYQTPCTDADGNVDTYLCR